jgi:hypothetical protein
VGEAAEVDKVVEFDLAVIRRFVAALDDRELIADQNVKRHRQKQRDASRARI